MIPSEMAVLRLGTLGARRIRGRFLPLAAALLVGGYAGLALVVAGHHADPLDQGVRALIGPLRGPELDNPMALVSRLGDGTGLIPMILVASALLWRFDRRWAYRLPLVMAGTGALQYLTKWLADRPRPNAAPWGFPSGHVLSFAVFAGVVAYLIATRSTRARWRLAASAAGVAALLAVAFSRLYLDMHWLSDVGGGFAIGMAYLLTIIWVAERARVGPATGRAGTEDGPASALLALAPADPPIAVGQLAPVPVRSGE